MSELLDSIEGLLGVSLDGISAEKIVRITAIVLGELFAIIIITVALTLLIRFAVGRLSSVASSEKIGARLEKFRKASKFLLCLVAFIGCLASLGLNGWLIWNGVDPLEKSVALFQAIPSSAWSNLAWAIVKIIGAIYLAKWLTPKISKLLGKAESKLAHFGEVHSNNRSISAFFSGLNTLANNTIWALLAIFASTLFNLPDNVYALLLKAVTVYLIISLGLLLVRTITVIVDTLDALSEKYASQKNWYSYYQALRPLIPLFRRCLEAVVWLVTATLALSQLEIIPGVAAYGFRLIQAIWVFFIARVVVELGHLLIQQNMLDADNLADIDLKRRATITPLFKSIFAQICYFVALVIILGVLGIDIVPLLAGAGILGIVIGLGAQPLINDIVSGFFILFENMFLVGDFVEVEGKRGTVESIDFRTTRLRDPDGNILIIRNGDMRAIKSYSKDYTFAVVNVRVAYKHSTKEIRDVLEACGKELRDVCSDLVMGDLVVKGIFKFGKSAMHFRTVTQVTPGSHFEVEALLREIIKRHFEEKEIEIPVEQRKIVST